MFISNISGSLGPVSACQYSREPHGNTITMAILPRICPLTYRLDAHFPGRVGSIACPPSPGGLDSTTGSPLTLLSNRIRLPFVSPLLRGKPPWLFRLPGGTWPPVFCRLILTLTGAADNRRQASCRLYATPTAAFLKHSITQHECSRASLRICRDPKGALRG